jgi:hypothetical protein
MLVDAKSFGYHMIVDIWIMAIWNHFPPIFPFVFEVQHDFT